MTKQQLTERAERAAQNETLLHLALNDVLNDSVKWFRRGKISIGICRPCDASGGIVVERYFGDGKPYACAYYWEHWFPSVRDAIPPATDQDSINRRNAALDAQQYVLNAQSHCNEEAMTAWNILQLKSH